MATKIESYETRVGELSVRALREGGERLLGKVVGQLGVVTRHCERVRAGQLELTDGLEGEIARCFRRVEDTLTPPERQG